MENSKQQRIVMTFGALPTREQFDAAWDGREDLSDLGFDFGGDARMGTCRVSCDELWGELRKAHAEYQQDGGESERAGDWCSSVLYCLGIEWV